MPRIRLNDGDATLPTLVCIPGAMCSPHVFAPMAARLPFTAYGVDWLASGTPYDLQSIAARIAASLGDLKRVVLIGHSLGTPLAVLAALSEGELSSRVTGLVLSNSGANTHGHGDVEGLVTRIENEWGEPFWTSFIKRCFRTLPEPPLLDEVRAYPSRVSMPAVVEAIRSQQAMDLTPLLPKLESVPVAVVHGEFDVARSLVHARQLHDGVRGSSLHTLPTGHTACAEAPDAFAEIVRGVASA